MLVYLETYLSIPMGF